METVAQKFRSLGCDVSINVPQTVEDFDLNAKKAGACLAEAVNNVIYRGTLNEFRDNFCEEVEKETGVERTASPTGKKNSDGTDVLEYDLSEGKYIQHVRTTKGWADDNTVLQGIADKVAATLTFDASAPERKPSEPKKLAAMYKEAATRIFTNGNQAKWGTQFNLTYTGDQAKDIELLGWAIKRDSDEKQKQLMAGVN